MLTAIDFADRILGALPALIAAGGDVLGLITRGRSALANMKAEARGPTPAEWDALDADIDGLMGQLKG